MANIFYRIACRIENVSVSLWPKLIILMGLCVLIGMLVAAQLNRFKQTLHSYAVTDRMFGPNLVVPPEEPAAPTGTEPVAEGVPGVDRPQPEPMPAREQPMPIDPDLSKIVSKWPELSESTRKSILILVEHADR